MKLFRTIKKNLAIQLPAVHARLLSGFSQGEIETIAGHVLTNSGRNPSQPVLSFARALSEKAATIPNMFASNGEMAMLDRLARLPLRMLFDVGTNIGTWSSHAAKVFPDADVHAFEIVPDTFAQLRSRMEQAERIHLNPFGLSDESGRVEIKLYSSNLISSMFSLANDGSVVSTIDCAVERGADYAANHAIDRIDILKIDVEGAEGKVLAGLEPMFSNRQIRLIQFEYNRGAILGDFLLKHAYQFFVPKGYRLGKLMPDGVHFHDYEFIHEDFGGPNYVACLDDDAEIIAAIAAPPASR